MNPRTIAPKISQIFEQSENPLVAKLLYFTLFHKKKKKSADATTMEAHLPSTSITKHASNLVACNHDTNDYTETPSA